MFYGNKFNFKIELLSIFIAILFTFTQDKLCEIVFVLSGFDSLLISVLYFFLFQK